MKKVWKAICTSLFLAVICLCSGITCFAATKNNGTFEYETNSANKTCKIIEYVGKSSTVNIPDKIQGYKVVTLGRTSFAYKELTKIVIPSTVKTIESGALSGNYIKEITIPKSVVSMGNGAFRGNIELQKVRMEAALKKIPDYAFYNCGKLRELNLSNTIKEIGDYAFFNCKEVRTVTLPPFLKKIGDGALGNWHGLKNLDLRNCEEIGDGALVLCDNLQTVKMNKCKKIEEGAFSGCKSLKEIRIPKTIISIESMAFYGCDNLKKAYIYNPRAEIEKDAFYMSEILTLYGYRNSTTEKYAKANNISFKDINAITSVSLNKTSLDMIIGNTFVLKTFVKPDSASNKNVVWTSSDTKVASVSSKGMVTAKSPGTAVVIAKTVNGKTAKCVVKVHMPKSTPITKLLSQKKGWLNIQYRAVPNANGYQIQYSTFSNMKNAKYVAVNNSKIRSYTRKDVKSGAIYYVRVRTFNLVDGERVYSGWSGIKSIKVK